MSWIGFLLKAGILSDGKNVAIQRGNLTVQQEIISRGIVPDEVVAAAATSFTIAQLLTGYIKRDPTGASRADPAPTAALMIAGIENVFVGAAFNFTIENTGTIAEVITLTAATGTTLSGNMTIDGGSLRHFRAVVTGVSTPAVTIYSLGAGLENLTAAELQVLDGAVAGTQAASKAVIPDANVNTGISKVTELHIGATSAEVQMTATPAEINQKCDLSVLGEIVTATHVLTAADNGKIFFLDSATEFTTTLPALSTVVPGWSCKFVVKAAPAAADYVITEHGDDTDKIVLNGINELEVDTNDDGPYHAGLTFVNFKDGIAVQGDWVVFETDGVNWYCTGQSNADGGVTSA